MLCDFEFNRRLVVKNLVKVILEVLDTSPTETPISIKYECLHWFSAIRACLFDERLNERSFILVTMRAYGQLQPVRTHPGAQLTARRPRHRGA